MQNLKKSEEGQEAIPTDERASDKERVLWNKKENGRAGEGVLIEIVHGDVKEASCSTVSVTFSSCYISLGCVNFFNICYRS